MKQFLFKGGIYVQAYQNKNTEIPELEDLVNSLHEKKNSPGYVRGILRNLANDLSSIGAEFVGAPVGLDFHISIADEAGDLIIAADSSMKRIMIEWIGYDGLAKSFGEFSLEPDTTYKDVASFVKKKLSRAAGNYMMKSIPEDL